ncbi:Cellulose-growth-specific protein [Hypsizygus marmoreus]|uniref:AA9 family lytic polysaccharide monooxygenase n=1 Tax=Hypsizygus marmoreus TaxID=39966 RepID=A0A369JKY4_HYPMA|nr:Cellulose-growth-specific protein [Hypsizygus marmoreus]
MKVLFTQPSSRNFFGVYNPQIPLALAAHGVHAHGGVIAYSNGGNWYNGFAPYNSPTGQTTIQRPWATYDPILSATASTIACNNDGAPGPNQLTATVAAGSSITAYWNTWPHPQGPQLTYLAQCPGSSCNGVNANTLKWFKIDEAGLLSGTVGNGKWAAGKMIEQNNTWTSTIPSTVPAGNYLIRFETIALHSLPAQHYPECAQIQITGGGSRAPTAAELVSFPGGYSNSDPGLTVNLYTEAAKTQYVFFIPSIVVDSQSEPFSRTYYPIPGPPLYNSGESGPIKPPVTSAPPTTTKPPVTSQPPVTTAPPVGTVPQYGQCGGQGYNGPTVCIAPYTCKSSNGASFVLNKGFSLNDALQHTIPSAYRESDSRSNRPTTTNETEEYDIADVASGCQIPEDPEALSAGDS